MISTQWLGGNVQSLKNLISLRDYCKNNKWPRLPQWQHWINSKNPIAIACVKKVGGRYMIDLAALENYVKNCTLD